MEWCAPVLVCVQQHLMSSPFCCGRFVTVDNSTAERYSWVGVFSRCGVERGVTDVGWLGGCARLVAGPATSLAPRSTATCSKNSITVTARSLSSAVLCRAVLCCVVPCRAVLRLVYLQRSGRGGQGSPEGCRWAELMAQPVQQTGLGIRV